MFKLSLKVEITRRLISKRKNLKIIRILKLLKLKYEKSIFTMYIPRLLGVYQIWYVGVYTHGLFIKSLVTFKILKIEI